MPFCYGRSFFSYGLADWAIGTAGAAIFVTFMAGAFVAISVRSLIYQFFSK
jgi:hypothetical protein